MNREIKSGIVGGAGYTGGELIRILLKHPFVKIVYANSRTFCGRPVHEVHKDLYGETTLEFGSITDPDIDVLFLCLSHGEARQYLKQNTIPPHVRIIDLSQDFRLGDLRMAGNRTFIYGLPEQRREEIRNAQNIANPGCFATAIQLALFPLSKGDIYGDIHITGITGSTGAGQKLQDTSHFSWRMGNVQAYKPLAHQHMYEVEEQLASRLNDCKINFVPWRGGFTRGIFLTACVNSKLTEEKLNIVYRNYYKDHPFTILCPEEIDLKQVINTNRCFLHLQKVNGQLIVSAAIDNLLKGASGQAVQNMNLMFGLPEDAGLKFKTLAY